MKFTFTLVCAAAVWFACVLAFLEIAESAARANRLQEGAGADSALEFFAPALYSAETRFIRMNPAPCRIAEDPAVPRLMKVTAYCPCDKCCGKYADGKTATNDDAYVCDGVAADFSLLPKRTVLEIPGAGVKEVDDTGGAMRRAGRENPPVYHIDLRFPAHEQALAWGVKWLDVEILLPPEL